MTDEIVWVSGALSDSTRTKFFDADNWLQDQAHAIDAMQRNAIGEPLPAERFAKEFYGHYPDKPMKKQQDLFYAGFWVVSAAVADVLRQFDLGQGGLYPVKLLQHDRKTPVEGEYFCLNFGNQKQAFRPEQSPNAQESMYQKADDRTLPFVTKDGDIAVTPEALTGPDIWIDPKLRRAFFVSDGLAKALIAAKLSRYFGLRKCRMVRMN